MAQQDLDHLNSWIEINARGKSGGQLLQLFERLLQTVWQSANTSITTVSLQVIFERAVEYAAESFFFVTLLKVDDQGIHFHELRSRASRLADYDIVEGFRILISRFISLLRAVTGGIVNPPLNSDMTTLGASTSHLAPAEDIFRSSDSTLNRLETGVRNLDSLLKGGLPCGSLVVFGGSPGSGKTILAQDIGFHHAKPESKVVFFQTLSEPMAKTLGYVQQFEFFDSLKIGKSVYFVDLGDVMRSKGLQQAVNLLMERLKGIQPSLIVIDSFKAFDDLTSSREEYRKFCYEVAARLVGWQCTSLLLGEFGPKDLETSPMFSVVDGFIALGQRLEAGEQQRFIQVVKMRGTDHNRDEHPYIISTQGIEVYAPRVTITRDLVAREELDFVRSKTGFKTLDKMIVEGIPRGYSILIAGVSGTGKTLLCLEFAYRGAKELNEKSIVFLFEETEQRIRATAKNMEWDFDTEIERGNIKIISIPQPDILVEKHLLMMHEEIKKMGAKRVVIDSVSVFLHKVAQVEMAREKIYQLATIVQKSGAIGFFSVNIPYGTNQLTRLGVEETVLDGVILLSSIIEGHMRKRYLEVYKIRNTCHLTGRKEMIIAKGGLIIQLEDEDLPGGMDVAA